MSDKAPRPEDPLQGTRSLPPTREMPERAHQSTEGTRSYTPDEPQTPPADPGPSAANELPDTRFFPEGPNLPESEEAHSSTADAPPLPTPLQPPPSRKGSSSGRPEPGERIDDFKLLSVLGSGSFASVYLATQVSLNRQVALKVSRLRLEDMPPGTVTDSATVVRMAGTEARTLASLEHPHIVQVYSEVTDPSRGLRLLCMQYVPGTTLERIIQALKLKPRSEWSGRAILDILDQQGTHPVALDPTALHDREFLGQCTFIEACCWFGTRLAQALAHAHALGVLHRDIKPANILVNRYGRPLLADFNVAASASHGTSKGMGGTLLYMAPEHLDAFNPVEPVTTEEVNHRADIYSLGMVLFELLTGEKPDQPEPSSSSTDLPRLLRQFAARRRAGAPSIRQHGDFSAVSSLVLDRVVQRCQAPQPEDRYESATDLADALDGCRDLLHIERELPRGNWVTPFACRSPFLAMALLALVPHFLGSVVNISYNQLRIVESLTPEQKATFIQLVLGYNAIVYPFCLFLLFRAVLPVYAGWKLLDRPEPPSVQEIDAIRQKACALPGWVIGLSCLGWLPGGLLFPLGLSWLAGPINKDVFGHFLVSFTVSGLIALTYSLFGAQFIVLRVLYPRLWVDPAHIRTRASQELAGLEKRFWLFQFLAVLIPLAGAVMMISVGPEQFTPASYRTFRLLVTTLLALGMSGLGVALTVSSALVHTLTALVGRETR